MRKAHFKRTEFEFDSCAHKERPTDMASLPWRFLETDSNGVVTVNVEEADLTCFPMFMHHIIKKGVGFEKGFFKVRFYPNKVSLTTLSELQAYIAKYFNSKVFVASNDVDCKGTRKYPKVDTQNFFYGHQTEHLYGYQSSHKDGQYAEKLRKSVIKKIKKSSNFSVQTHCMKLQQVSTDSLLEHYWSVIRGVSEKSSGMDLDQEDPDICRLLEKAKPLRSKYCFTKDASVSIKTEFELEKKTRSAQTKQDTPKFHIIYPSGIPVQKAFKITPTFSLSELGTVLDLYPKKVDGISNPFLYVGCEYASFAWHIEDVALFSLNFLHYGADCVWFFTPPDYFGKFTEWARFFLLDVMQVTCVSVLGAGHKYILAGSEFLKKLGIPVDVVFQKAGEMIVTYPFTLHSGFKTGWNIQEAVNFADEWWVEPAIVAPLCDCFCDQPLLKMDLTEIIAVCREDLLKMYLERDFLGLLKMVSHNPFIKRLRILPSFVCESTDGQQIPPDPVVNEIMYAASANSDKGTETQGNNLPPLQVIEEEIEHTVNTSLINYHTALPKKETKCGRNLSRTVLECPHELCTQKYEGGLGRLDRLKKHITVKHGGDPALFTELCERYTRKFKSKSSVLCYLCGETKAGGNAHLKLHIARKHPGIVFPSK